MFNEMTQIFPFLNLETLILKEAKMNHLTIEMTELSELQRSELCYNNCYETIRQILNLSIQ